MKFKLIVVLVEDAKTETVTETAREAEHVAHSEREALLHEIKALRKDVRRLAHARRNST